MSRSFFKSLVMTGMVAMMSTGAYAADDMGDDYKFKVKGKIRTYFGQYSTGVEGTSSYMQEFNEGNLAGEVVRGPMKGYFELESRATGTLKDTMRKITYDMGNGLNVGIGTAAPIWNFAFSNGAGTMTSESAGFGFFSGLVNKLEGDGLNLEYKAGDHKLGLTMYEDDRYNKVAGSTTQAGAAGKFGPLAYRVGVISATTDAHTGGDTLSHSGNTIGLQYKMDGMAFSLDLESKTLGKADTGTTSSTTGITTYHNSGDDYTDTTSATSVQGTIGIGEHSLIVTLGSTSQKADYTTAKETKTADTSLVYVIPVAEKADFRFLYGSQGKTVGTADTVAKSFVGGGMYILF